MVGPHEVALCLPQSLPSPRNRDCWRLDHDRSRRRRAQRHSMRRERRKTFDKPLNRKLALHKRPLPLRERGLERIDIPRSLRSANPRLSRTDNGRSVRRNSPRQHWPTQIGHIERRRPETRCHISPPSLHSRPRRQLTSQKFPTTPTTLRTSTLSRFVSHITVAFGK